MKTDRISRRNFIGKTAVVSGLAAIAPGKISKAFTSSPDDYTPHRQIWIAGFSMMGLHAATPDEMVDQVIETLKLARPYNPDFVCLPELFPFANVDRQTTPSERIEISDRVRKRFSEYSKQSNCYTICPVHTQRNGKVFNSAVFFDRNGNEIGLYEKMHLADYEIGAGYSCGPLFQPVINTEFGPVGVQICFDIEWDDGWTMLRKQGAKIIFWPSAFAGGQCVNTKAWEHKCIVVSATGKNTAKICDISGEVVGQSGIWNPNLFCASVNPEKAFLHTWPSVLRFDEIRKKYGRKIRIVNYNEEEWSIIESLSADIRVKDILSEFNLKTHEELTSDAEALQQKSRF